MMNDAEPAAVTPSTLTTSTEPTWRLVLKLAVPVLIQQSLSLVVLLSDQYLAGHLPKEEIGEHHSAYQAAQTNAHYLAWLITNYAVLVTTAATAMVARFVGAGDQENAVHVTHQALLLALYYGLMGSAVALGGGLTWIVGILHLKGLVAELAIDYLTPIFLLMTFQLLEAVGLACLIGAGDTRIVLWVMLGVAGLNLPLSWGLSHGWWPLPNLGFVGISLGTALSHTLGGVVVLVVLARGRFGLRLSRKLFVPHVDLLRRLLRIGVPAGLDSLSVVVGQFWFLSIVNRLDQAAVSAHGIALRWEALGYLSGAAFGTAAMALVGQNLGAGKPERAAHSGWVAFLLGCAVMSAMGVLFFVLARPMFYLFCPFAEQLPIIEAGVPVLRLIAFAMPALASSIVLTQALRGAGDTRVPVLFTWIGFFAVRIPLAYWFILSEIELPVVGTVPCLGLGLFGAWLAMFADLVVRGGFFLYRFAAGSWKRISV